MRWIEQNKSQTGIYDFICLKEFNLNTLHVDLELFWSSANNDWSTYNSDSQGTTQPEFYKEVLTSADREQLKLTGPGA